MLLSNSFGMEPITETHPKSRDVFAYLVFGEEFKIKGVAHTFDVQITQGKEKLSWEEWRNLNCDKFKRLVSVLELLAVDANISEELSFTGVSKQYTYQLKNLHKNPSLDGLMGGNVTVQEPRGFSISGLLKRDKRVKLEKVYRTVVESVFHISLVEPKAKVGLLKSAPISVALPKGLLTKSSSRNSLLHSPKGSPGKSSPRSPGRFLKNSPRLNQSVESKLNQSSEYILMLSSSEDFTPRENLTQSK